MDKEKEVSGNGDTRYLRPILSKKQIIVNNFIGGFFWALGTIIGLALLATVAGFILTAIDFNLILGDWLGGIIKESVKQIQPSQYR